MCHHTASGVDVMGQEIHNNVLQLLCIATDGWAKNVTYDFFFCRVGVIMDQWWHLKQVYNICIDEK